MRTVAARWFHSPSAEAVVWRSTLLFVGVDVFYTGFVGAYAFTHGQVLAVLLFIAGQQAATVLGQVAANRLMAREAWPALRLQRAGVAALAGTLVLAGALPVPVTARLVLLCGLGGLARGLSYGARLWLEANLPGAAVRQAYLCAVEAAATLLKLFAPLWALLVFRLFSESLAVVFLSAGLAALALLACMRHEPLSLPPARKAAVLALLRQPRFWRTAPYYVVEGAGHALRLSLFVCGAMTVVGSLSGYAWVEALASLLGAGLLTRQALRAQSGPSLRTLRRLLGLMALAWASLLAALQVPWFLFFFVAGYAVGLPLVNAQKMGVTLGGMVKEGASLEASLLGRSIVLTASRVGTLGLCASLSLMGWTPRMLLLGMVGLTLALLPLEYWTAHRMQAVRRA
ncbi:hypothetical protein [uncultured Azohydromonas sp.]|uniref:hypothetical protein n=1 Tax=uncultured Azohydromonas sp. TaxID=487342 RepID=UPI002621D5DA|nr:hypothetical protein [uncultured Azohydromonas sp.]